MRTKGRERPPAPQIAPELANWLRNKAFEVCRRARKFTSDGTPVTTPTASGHYGGGTWIRDLVWAAAGSGEAIPTDELAGNLTLFLERQGTDGSLPCTVDRRTMQGGWAGPYDIPDLDSPMFAALGCALVARRSGSATFYEQWRGSVLRAIRWVPRDEKSGLVWVNPEVIHVSYGWHDTIYKPVRELICSALMSLAMEALANLEEQCANSAQSAQFRQEAYRIRDSLEALWNLEGYFCGYDGGPQPSPPDVWGTALVVCEGLVPDGIADQAAAWLRDNLGSFWWNGHVRALPLPMEWPLTTLTPGEIEQRGVYAKYQSTFYWQMAAGWVARAVARVDESLACQLAETYVRNMMESGIWECVRPPDIFKGEDNLSSICVPASCMI